MSYKMLNTHTMWKFLYAGLKKPTLRLFYLLFFTFYFSSCAHEDYLIPQANENLRPAADFIKNNYDFSLLYSALQYTDLVTELNGPGPFTVLGVNNAGFHALGIFTTQDIHKLNRDSLRQVLQYHILKERRLLTKDIPTNAVDVRYETLSGDALYASAATPQSRFYFDGADAEHKDVILSNGVMHVLSKMMKYHKGMTVQAYLENNPTYSIFVSGLKKFGLWDELAGEGPFTIFAPNNDAFSAQGISAETINGLNAAGYHKRLFTTYIMYSKHYFISDHFVFVENSDEGNFEYVLKDDNWYLVYTSVRTFPGWVLHPALRLMKPMPLTGIDEQIGTVSRDANKSNIAKYDHRLENGLVHDLHSLLILPHQAVN